MNALEITIKNIQENGFRVGKAVRGKGYELYEEDVYFAAYWGRVYTNEEYAQTLFKKFAEVNVDELYIKDIWYKAQDNQQQRHFTYKDKEQSQSQINLQELIDKEFEGTSSVEIYKSSNKLLGYFPISKYKSDLDSQREMIRDLFKFNGLELYKDEFYDFDDEWQYDDEVMSFNSDGYNGDYALVHGESDYMEDKSECERINGKPEYHNSMILDDFWNMEYEECFKTYLNELDPKDKICVYHRKGKDWYVGYQYTSQEIIISYRDEDGEICEEGEFVLFYEEDRELIQKFVKAIESQRDDLAIRSYIYNELETGEESSTDYYNDDIVNQTMVDLIYEDKNDLRDEIMESIKNWDIKTIKEEFARVYHAIIDSKVIVEEDLTIQITTIPCQMVTSSKTSQTTTYNHLKLIKRLEKRYGYELVKTSVSNSLNMVQWAIKQGNEEYHFVIEDVISCDIDGTQTLKEFIVEVIEALEKRKLEKLSQAELFKQASHVFIGIEDSIKAGNCQYGTNQFILKHRIDTKKIGGIRGDVLLEMENSNFTKRAVNHAIISHGGVA